MKRCSIVIVWLVAALTLSSTSLAQLAELARPGDGKRLVSAAKTADEGWASVIDLSQPKAVPGPTPTLGPDELSQARLLVEASEAAKAFNEKFSEDPRAGAARKLEALLALQSVQLGAKHYKTTAFAVGAAYRADRKNSDTDRFDVAFMMEGVSLAETLGGKRFIDDGEKYEQLADSLYAELGDTPEIYGLYTSIARTTDMISSVRVAKKLLGMKKTPEWAKDQAQAIVSRSDLIGQPLGLQLTTIGGTVINLSQPTDRPTVVYYWHSSAAERDFAALEHFKRSIKIDARWLMVGIGGEPPVSDRPMAGSRFAESHCFESAQFGRPATTQLKLQQTPYAFVVDAAGRLIGYGAPETIASLLQAAAK